MKIINLLAVGVLAGLTVCGSADAASRTRELNNKSIYTPADAIKGQDYVRKAMTTPMMDLLQKADVNHPEMMLTYGLALDLGRTSVSSEMNKEDREKLKRGFRAMLDLYLNKQDKFDITFDEDAMLDQSEFWIYLAKHVGRKKQQQPLNGNLGMTSDPSQGTSGFFVPDQPQENSEFNLNQDLVLRPNVVNAATSCAESAFGFARMKKAQLVDISETKLTPDQFAQVEATAARVYRTSYSLGISACGSRDFFMEVADFSSQNLGKLGAMKDNPAAILADLNVAPEPEPEPAAK